MRIDCPLCGLRDIREFHYLGSAKLLARPSATDVENPQNDLAAFHDYLYIRENIEGENHELWLHEFGCRAWLQITRNTETHNISSVKFAREIKR